VHGDPPADSYAERADFCELILVVLIGYLRPYAGCGGVANAFDIVLGDGVDNNLFESVHVVAYAEVEAFEVEDGVGDELSRAVVGDVSAAVGLLDFDSELSEAFGWCGDVLCGGGSFADSDDGRIVLEEQEFHGRGW